MSLITRASEKLAANVSSSKNYGCLSNVNQLKAIVQQVLYSVVKYCLRKQLLNLEIKRSK